MVRSVSGEGHRTIIETVILVTMSVEGAMTLLSHSVTLSLLSFHKFADVDL
jgi:hypothetical protein